MADTFTLKELRLKNGSTYQIIFVPDKFYYDAVTVLVPDITKLIDESKAQIKMSNKDDFEITSSKKIKNGIITIFPSSEINNFGNSLNDVNLNNIPKQKIGYIWNRLTRNMYITSNNSMLYYLLITYLNNNHQDYTVKLEATELLLCDPPKLLSTHFSYLIVRLINKSLNKLDLFEQSEHSYATNLIVDNDSYYYNEFNLNLNDGIECIPLNIYIDNTFKGLNKILIFILIDLPNIAKSIEEKKLTINYAIINYNSGLNYVSDVKGKSTNEEKIEQLEHKKSVILENDDLLEIKNKPTGETSQIISSINDESANSLIEDKCVDETNVRLNYTDILDNGSIGDTDTDQDTSEELNARLAQLCHITVGSTTEDINKSDDNDWDENKADEHTNGEDKPDSTNGVKLVEKFTLRQWVKFGYLHPCDMNFVANRMYHVTEMNHVGIDQAFQQVGIVYGLHPSVLQILQAFSED